MCLFDKKGHNQYVSSYILQKALFPLLRNPSFDDLSHLILGSHRKAGCCASGKSWKSAAVHSSEKRKYSNKARSRGTEMNHRTLLKYFRTIFIF